MEKDFNLQMKETLLALKKEVLDQIVSNDADFHQIVEGTDSKDEVDVANDEIDIKMLEAKGIKDLNRLKLIENAIIRIEQGKYGICVRCRKQIPQERLKTIPYALMCVQCQSEEERKNR